MSSNERRLVPGNARFRRLAIFAAVALLATIAAIGLSRHAFQWRNVAVLEQRMSRLLGFEVSIRGPVFVQSSIRPLLTLQDVHLRDAGDRSSHEALAVRELRIRLNPLPLLLDRWSIAALELADARLCISPEPDSACDWQRALEAIDQVTRIDRLTIQQLNLRCTGGICGQEFERRIALIRAKLPAHRGMRLTIYEKEAGDAPLADLSAASWSAFRADRPLPVRGTLQSGPTLITFVGEIEQPRELRGVTVDFDGRTDLGQWHRVALGKVTVHGRLAETADGYRLVVDKGKWGTGTVSADVHAKRGNPGLALEGTFAAHHVDLDPWIDAPTQGQGAGGYLDVDGRFKTAGVNLDQWRKHLRGSAHVAAGPAELPVEQVERWSKGFLKFVMALPAEGASTHVNCMGGSFELKGETAETSLLRLDTEITRMRAAGAVSLRSGEIDFLVKPELKKGPLKSAPLVAVSGRIEQPISRLASAEEASRSKPIFEHVPEEPRDSRRPCQ